MTETLVVTLSGTMEIRTWTEQIHIDEAYHPDTQIVLYQRNVRELVATKYPRKRHDKGPNAGQLSGNPKGENLSDICPGMQQEWETGLWDIPNVKSNHPEKTGHPAQFPTELVVRCVLAMTNPGGWVLDPYAGVGSSLIAALKRNRRAMGSEKESKYMASAQQRTADFFAGNLKIRPLGKPVFQPSGKEEIAQYPPEWQTRNRL